MSSSVLGLGAAALGAASLGAYSVGNKPVKMIKAPQPSGRDYRLGQMGLLYGDTSKFYASDKDKIKAAFGTGPVIGGSGQFYYGEAPTKVPKGYMSLRGPDISVQGRSPLGGSYRTSVDTYSLVPLQQPQAQPLPQIDLTQGGKKNKLNVADINYAQQQGATRKEIRQAVKAQDIRMSAKAKARIFKNKKNKG